MNATDYFAKLNRTIAALDLRTVDEAVALVAKAHKKGRQIITLGNGGSSLTALHFITDWNKMVYLATGKPFRGRSLVDNIGLTFAYSNDIAFEDVFVEQLKNILEKDDLVIALSGSGNSPNVIKAVEYANSHDAITLGLCGYDGGKLAQVSQYTVWVDIKDMQISEDIHSMFGHIVVQKLCKIGAP